MKIAIHYCINCGERYMFQWSGNYDAIPDVPKEYRDKDYCPECKKAIVDALTPITKKSEIKWLPTTEVDIDTLLKWEEELREKQIAEDNANSTNHPVFPRGRRVWAGLYNTDIKENSRQEQVMNPENRRLYFYRFYPSKKNEAVITVQARVKFGTNEIIDYR